MENSTYKIYTLVLPFIGTFGVAGPSVIGIAPSGYSQPPKTEAVAMSQISQITESQTFPLGLPGSLLDYQKVEIFNKLAEILLDCPIEPDPEIAEIIADHFWELD
ncbi:MAG: hypothetical protein D4R64_05365 [Porphyromonadaceae bacterium]|nr:MAG: hypothetical protein D4R64_05365 [Porphyromonadaceae bacterium]